MNGNIPTHEDCISFFKEMKGGAIRQAFAEKIALIDRINSTKSDKPSSEKN